MKKILIVMVLALFATTALAGGPLPDAPHVAVHGHSERLVVPDKFVVELTVTKTSASVPEAKSTVEQIVDRIMSVLAAAHVEAKDVQATNLSIGPDYDYESGKSVFKGNEASRDIKVSFFSLKSLGDFLAALPTGPEVRVKGVSSSSTQAESIKADLRRLAIAATKTKAVEMAAAYDLKVKGVFSISDTPPSSCFMDSGVVYDAPAAAADFDPSSRIKLSEGRILISEDVYTVFLIGS